jgi:hypothetical protein
MISFSYILPFYHKIRLFKLTFPANLCFAQPDAEVVCVLDEPSDEKEMLEFIEKNQQVKFRVVVNDKIHNWRPPCIPYNVGIRNAVGNHVVLTDPEVLLGFPRPNYLSARVWWSEFRMLAGLVWHVSEFTTVDTPEVLHRRVMTEQAIAPPCMWGYGAIVVPKRHMETICGFDESRTVYGMDDNDIRYRLTRFGVTAEIDPFFRSFHMYHPNPMNRRDKFENPSMNVVLQEQSTTWGKEYGRISYDWNRS